MNTHVVEGELACLPYVEYFGENGSKAVVRVMTEESFKDRKYPEEHVIEAWKPEDFGLEGCGIGSVIRLKFRLATRKPQAGKNKYWTKCKLLEPAEVLSATDLPEKEGLAALTEPDPEDNLPF